MNRILLGERVTMFSNLGLISLYLLKEKKETKKETKPKQPASISMCCLFTISS